MTNTLTKSEKWEANLWKNDGNDHENHFSKELVEQLRKRLPMFAVIYRGQRIEFDCKQGQTMGLPEQKLLVEAIEELSGEKVRVVRPHW